jgi:hypothetical protein
VHRHRDAQEGIDRFQFFADKTQRDVIESRTAVLFGDAYAEQTELGHLLENFRMGFLLLVPFLDVRRDFFLRKLAHGLD